MVYKARLLISGRQKMVIALLLLALIGFLMNYPRITEALLAFLLGGVVPGTNIIVSPDVVLLAVLAVFIIGAATLVLRIYFKAARGKRNFRIAVQAIESEVVLPVARDTVMPLDPKVGVRAAAAVRKRHAISMFVGKAARHVGHGLAVIGEVLSGFIRSVAVLLMQALRTVGRWVFKGLSFAVEALYTFLVLVWYGVETIAKFIYRLAIRMAKAFFRATQTAALWLVRSLKSVWRWSRPRLKRFDSWLEVQLRKLETHAVRQFGRHESVRTVAAMGREYRKSVHELHPKIVLRTANQKAGAMKTKLVTAQSRTHRPAKS